MKLLAFAATNTQPNQSINHQWVKFAAAHLKEHDVELLDLNAYEMPIYSQHREQESGIPAKAHAFFDKIGQADAILISFAEHNGNYTSAYKNIFDWASRIDQKVYQNKPMILLSTSPGPGGANNVLTLATTSAPYFAADVKGHMSLPSFYEHFDLETQTLKDQDLQCQLEQTLQTLFA